MKKGLLVLAAVLAVVVLVAAFSLRGRVGVPLDKLEQDARRSQRIHSSMQCAIHSTDEMAALLFYNEDSDHAIYSIYLKGEGLSFGYFFREGGDLNSAGIDGVLQIDYLGKGSVALSLNKVNVFNIVADACTSYIYTEEPFTYVFPPDIDTIYMFDKHRNAVPFDLVEGRGEA